jgi:uncharacterized lipoprotein YajG
MKKSMCIVLGGLLLPVACAFSQQQVTLSPVVNVASSDEGNHIEVAVRVVDERATLSLGRRGNEDIKGGEIIASQDVALVVQRQVVDGLRKKAFKPVEYSEAADPRLTVEVRLLEYSTSKGFWTGGVHIRSALKVIAHRSGNTYEHMYRNEREERVVIVPTADTNEQWINEVLGDTLKELFRDRDLFALLSAR